MVITAALVKELRERTSAGMMECKKALVESNGDIDVAIDMMRKSSLVKAVKKEGRTTAEGTIVVLSSADAKTAVLVEVNCETDFVARGNGFKDFAKAVAEKALAEKIQSLAALQAAFEEQRLALISEVGELITIRRFVLKEQTGESVIGIYAHGDANGTRIGSVVSLKKGTVSLAKDLAMHVAAMQPEYVLENEIPAERLEKEKEIFVEQTREEKKPEAMMEKIVEGKLKKFIAEITLMGQSFVKDSTKTVAALLKESDGEIEFFVRFAVGEGIEKQEDNFVAEVMAQVKG